MRLIVRKERSHPGARVRFADADGLRLTCFATNTTGQKIAVLELWHRQRARAEDRVRADRSTGLRTCPCTMRRGTRSGWRSSRQPWTCRLGCRCLALIGTARLWEPRRLRLRLLFAAAQLITTTDRRHLRFAGHWPWSEVITEAIQRLAILPDLG
ncbi:transposase [Streptomyces europaeiscabiei]|uniref:transposase n=1 Tax=Streptomyces europaeiscabiei TaxID=146819 RepID=UPI0039A59C08